MKDLFKSKKFLAAIAATLVALAAKVGLELDQESVLLIVSPLVAYILSQGWADNGKERAKIIVNNLPQEDVEDLAIVEIDEEVRP